MIDEPVVYKIKCIPTGKFYVGSAKNFRERINVHLSALRRNKSNCKKLQHAFNKHGEVNFSIEIIEIIQDVNLLRERELFWINKLGVIESGLNIARDTNMPMLGRKHSEKTKRLMRKNHRHLATNLGKKFSDEHKAKIGEANRGNKRPDFSEIVRRKNKERSKLKSDEVIKIRDLANNNYTKVAIAKMFGVSPSCIRSILEKESWAWLQ